MYTLAAGNASEDPDVSEYYSSVEDFDDGEATTPVYNRTISSHASGVY